ncbi:antitermination protein BlgG [Lachnoclostridium sp. An196]|uniref:PRD domain-containing protein n=1 Tax=Lachnoclostridium sp. An196 TaxID=1965583 RepID=UPI000B3820E0|nr:PRD domain-containing protein [Lachnoclostridium sp. An196]OUP19017.1 antitermination protein BlgG [Lachnoclostridium sp. An196]
MIIRKVLNNNLLLVDEQGQEQIAMGRGLRFSYKVGDTLNESDVEKIYILKDEKNTRDYIRLLEDVPSEYAEVIQNAIQLAQEKMHKKLNEQIFVTLLDHLLYALERDEKGIVLYNRMLWEIQKFYPKEYQTGLQVLEYINKKLGRSLPDAEAGNIAFHLVNAQMAPNMEGGARNGMLMVKMLKDIFQIVQLYYKKQIDEDSINYSRFAVHMQFFLQRLLEDKMLENGVATIYDSVAREQKNAAGCVSQIQKYIRNFLKKEIPKEEQIYLIVHIARVMEDT